MKQLITPMDYTKEVSIISQPKNKLFFEFFCPILYLKNQKGYANSTETIFNKKRSICCDDHNLLSSINKGYIPHK